MATAVDVDLRIALPTMDETGLPWTFLDEAPDPSRIVRGRHIVAALSSLMVGLVVGHPAVLGVCALVTLAFIAFALVLGVVHLAGRSHRRAVAAS